MLKFSKTIPFFQRRKFFCEGKWRIIWNFFLFSTWNLLTRVKQEGFYKFYNSSKILFSIKILVTITCVQSSLKDFGLRNWLKDTS